MERLRSFLNLEPGEEVPTALLFLHLALALASIIIAKTASKALFLNQFGALALPYAYIAVAILMGAVACLYVRLSSRIGQTTLIPGTLILFALSAVAIWWLVRLWRGPLSVIFYIWTSIFAAITTTQLWTLANSVLNLRQAKRLFPLVSSGGILGGTLGGVIAAAAVKSVGTDALILFLAPLLAFGVAIVLVLVRWQVQARLRGATAGLACVEDVETVWKALVSNRHVQMIVALVAVSAIATLIIDFQFNLVAQHSFPAKDQLTAFFGMFYAYVGVFTFLLMFFAGSRIVEGFSVRVTLLILPLALLAGTSVLLFYPLKLLAASLLKGSDAGLRYSIDKSAVELLYLPLPESTRAETKAVIDMVLQRLADAVGGVSLLLMTRVLDWELRGVGFFNLTLFVAWAWIAIKAHGKYVLAVQANITRRPADPKATFIGPNLSLATLRSLLESNDDEIVLFGLERAMQLRRTEEIPRKLATHASRKVRLRALEIMRLPEAQFLERAISDNDSAVRALAVERACETSCPGDPRSAVFRYLEAPDVRVRLAALANLARGSGKQQAAETKKYLEKAVEGLTETSEQWKEVAEALGDIRHPAAVDLHVRLLQHPNRTVKKKAVLSAGQAGHRELVPYLIPLLADRRFASEARQALQKYGSRVLGTLADILRDPTEDIEIRRAIPHVLAYMRDQEAVNLLLECLFDYDGLLRYRAILALGKLRVIAPELQFDRAKVALRIREECENTLWFRQALVSLYPEGDGQDLLAQLLREKIARGRERAFRLLALLLPPTVACASFMAIVEDDLLVKASVAEYLDIVLPGKLRRVVLPLIEPRQGLFRRRQSVRTILNACRRRPDLVLRECVADAIAKNRWPEFSDLASAVPAD